MFVRWFLQLVGGLFQKRAGIYYGARGVRGNKHHDFNGESCFVPSAVFVVWAANHKEEAPETRTFRRAEELESSATVAPLIFLLNAIQRIRLSKRIGRPLPGKFDKSLDSSCPGGLEIIRNFG
jgi:hypothetical protein